MSAPQSINMKTSFKIGTRGSPLAIIQANEVKKQLQRKHAELRNSNLIEIKKIKTSGDLNQDVPLAEIGGKGLFSKEIDLALLQGQIDIAVHSLKDLETLIHDQILLCAVLEREDFRDVMLSKKGASLASLSPGSIIGTSSPRRRAQILNLFPHLKCVSIRGNLQRRLRKLESNEVDAIVLAIAGLKRLGLSEAVREIIEPEVMLPAVAQGTIGITCRKSDKNIIKLIKAINHKDTMDAVKAERSMLAALGGSCRTPIGGLAILGSDKKLWLRGVVLNPDGSNFFYAHRQGLVGKSEELGLDVGNQLRMLSG